MNTLGKLPGFCIQKQVLCADIAKKKMSELVSITNLLRQTSLEFGNCKI